MRFVVGRLHEYLIILKHADFILDFTVWWVYSSVCALYSSLQLLLSGTKRLKYQKNSGSHGFVKKVDMKENIMLTVYENNANY